MKSFSDCRELLLSQLDHPVWLDETGYAPEKLDAELEAIFTSEKPRLQIRAEMFACILRHARLAVTPQSAFGITLDSGYRMPKLRDRWIGETARGDMAELCAEHADAARTWTYSGACDFGHVAPDWAHLLKTGFPGILAEIRDSGSGDTPEETPGFISACETVLTAVLELLERMSGVCRQNGMDALADDLTALKLHAPETLRQAYLVLDLVYLFLTKTEGENLRSMGRLDCLLNPLLESDLASGLFTRDELAELTRHFFAKMHAYRFSANVAFTLGGVDSNGADVVNDYSRFAIEVYRTMNIHDPKMQIRIADSTPSDFLRSILDCIRDGMNSFVFISDSAVIPAFEKRNIPLKEARDYLLIGCYEPAVCGKEVPCTCNGTINLPKVVRLAMNNGIDPDSGKRIGPETGECSTFEELMRAVNTRLRFCADGTIAVINGWEHYYSRLNPAPFFSALLPDCVRRKRDVYEGGARYNNSSINSICVASAVDALCAVQKFVYEDHLLTLDELNHILENNWEGQELLRLRFLKTAPKYGNADPAADAITAQLTGMISSAINQRPNGRGGTYRSGLFSIDWNINYGKHTGATADGRKAGEVLSKNMSATIGCDRKGVTSLLRSTASVDFTDVPNGTVLDLTLHPSVTSGSEGLDTLERILRTGCALRNFSIHINIMSAEQLRAAQEDPEKYSNLQIRVCGWNDYFVNLNRNEQDIFIRRAEAAEA